MTKTTTRMTMGMGVGAIGAILLFVTGCGSSRVVHTLDANDPVNISAGGCFVVATANIPGGADTSYDVFDNAGDNMDIAVVDSSVGCDPSPADTAFTSGTGSVSFGGTIPVSSSYDLQIFCNNIADTCIPTVDSWTWE